ncbi:MAG: DUF4491 family protein [Ruminiclostridium sp.]
MYITGVVIGLFSFAVIGAFHPIVIKSEYYFSEKIWSVFLIFGLLFLGCSIVTKMVLLSSLFSILGFTCLWSIRELKEQRERVKKGWFPQNPKKENNL